MSTSSSAYGVSLGWDYKETAWKLSLFLQILLPLLIAQKAAFISVYYSVFLHISLSFMLHHTSLFFIVICREIEDLRDQLEQQEGLV